MARAGSARLLLVGMDVCALPNNNHPEKFLQLDVGMLPLTQVGALMLGQRRWQNRVYVQVGRRSAVGSLACLGFPGRVKHTGGRCELSGTPMWLPWSRVWSTSPPGSTGSTCVPQPRYRFHPEREGDDGTPPAVVAQVRSAETEHEQSGLVM